MLLHAALLKKKYEINIVVEVVVQFTSYLTADFRPFLDKSDWKCYSCRWALMLAFYLFLSFWK